jgi:predicted flap endonuclease-1-like 5' DNA nuclease
VQHQETRTEQRNSELLRTELALLRTEKAKWEHERERESVPPPASEPAPPPLSRPSQWPALQRANSRHSEDIRVLRAEHRQELEKVRSLHATEIANLKKSLFSGSAAHTDDGEAKLAELEAKYEARLEALRKRLREVEHDGGAGKADEINEALEAERAKNAELLLQVEALTKELALAREQREDSRSSSSAALSHGDDLEKLKGVGPKMAKALRDLGITSLGQVADFTDEDLARIAPKIRWTVARIKKSGWVETAQRLR